MVVRRAAALPVVGGLKAMRNGALPEGGPVVSIVVPAYDDEAYVGRALDSCLAQTYADIEVVCVDDGSTDGTLAALAQIADGAEARGRVKVVALGRNGGTHNARRAGVEQASGDYIVFLDADDELMPDACAAAVAEFESRAPGEARLGRFPRRGGLWPSATPGGAGVRKPHAAMDEEGVHQEGLLGNRAKTRFSKGGAPDDEVPACAPIDILDFGTRVSRDGRASAQQALDMAEWMRPVDGELIGRDILVQTFVELNYPFSVIAKAFRAEPVKRAFDALGPRESDFGEDALEYFAIAFFSKAYRGVPARRLYTYHLGDGLSARRDMTAAEFARSLRGMPAIEGVRAFLESQGAFDEHADIYAAHRANQLDALLRSWASDVSEQDRDEVLRLILGIWPRGEVVDALCGFGSWAVDALGRCTDGGVELTDEQRYRCGLADGAAAARAECEASASFRIGRAATAIPRALRAHLAR